MRVLPLENRQITAGSNLLILSPVFPRLSFPGPDYSSRPGVTVTADKTVLLSDKFSQAFLQILDLQSAIVADVS